MQDPTQVTALPKAVPSPMADQAYESIRQSIVAGRFRPGDKLVEARLADELGISRGPVREGLKRLRQDGLIVHHPNQGMFVRVLSVDDVRSLYEVRVALETAAIRLLVRGGSVPKRLTDLIATMSREADRGRIDAAIPLGYEFHRALCETSGNPYLLHFFDVISVQVQLVLQIDSTEYLRYSNPDDYVRSHAELLQLIGSGEEARAAVVLEAHILLGQEQLLAKVAGESASLSG